MPAQEAHTVRAVDWKAVFPFLHLFRAFRVAIHPSKLLLGLALVLLLYGAGRAMDVKWPRRYPQVDSVVVNLPEAREFEPSTFLATSGPFAYFLNFELTHLTRLSQSVLEGDLGLWSLPSARPGGIVGEIYQCVFAGPVWAFRNHAIFASIFTLLTLFGWALFGGAIARIAAVHVARDEKISVRSALRFSSGKLLSFIFAPILLAAFMGALGLFIAVVNTLFYIPYIGPILVGAGFIFTLAAGFVLTLALFGTVGGSGLMYPTVAVEGSDSFDAISRSFSYVSARPGRLILYSLLAVVYGVLTYLFIKLFIFVMFAAIQLFQMWFLTTGRGSTGSHFETFFPPVQFWSLTYDIDSATLANETGYPGRIGAGLLAFWYYLVVGLLGAYAVSFYFSASTIIYYLLRLEVDATELDDVYLEETEDEELSDLPVSTASLSSDPPTAGADAPPRGDDSNGDPATVGAPSPMT